jgi:N-acetylmuramoyl-L-alanine amidase
MLLSRCTECETSSVRALDLQLLHQINITKPGVLVRIDDIPDLILGSSVHPWVQSGVRKCLINALAARPGVEMTINSAYRTIVGQQLLRSHYQAKRCNIVAAAPAGKSNHNNASSIDIEDADGWKEALINNGFTKLGDFDPMHYDCKVGIIDLMPVSIIAFQQLWNLAYPSDKLALDGAMGMLTLNRLKNAPVEGLPNLPVGYPSRTLKLTDPIQSGEDVRSLQSSLKMIGIAIEVDGVFGGKTTRAIEEWEKIAGLVPKGVGYPSIVDAIENHPIA